MFIRKKDLERLDIPSQRVLRLQRSLSDVQVALPGFPAQPATAYLCAFGVERGVRVVVALHLQTSRRVVFYVDDAGAASKKNPASLFDEGMQFAESMGFMLGELDFQQITPEARAALWNSLPLKNGNRVSAGAARPAPAGGERAPEPSPPVVKVAPPPEIRAPRRKEMVENLGRFLASF